jgi:hypothetical protein
MAAAKGGSSHPSRPRRTEPDMNRNMNPHEGVGLVKAGEASFDRRRKHARAKIMRRRVLIYLSVSVFLSGAANPVYAARGTESGRTQGRSVAHAPTLDVRQSCRESSILDCLTDENIARKQLIKQWSKFTRQGKERCAEEEKYSGPPTYVGWLTCLEIYADTRNVPSGFAVPKHSSRDEP